jgi:hypothetical protein
MLLTYYYSQFQRDCVFGSLGPIFSHKWQGPGFAHPPPSHLPQAIHWARLAAKANPQIYTILINPNTNWSQQTNIHSSPYLDTHIIAYFLPNTIQYTTLTTSLHIEDPHIEPNAI